MFVAIKRLHRELQELRSDALFTQPATPTASALLVSFPKARQEDGSSTQEAPESRGEGANTQTPLFTVWPLEDNFFDWHFTMRGPEDSPYADGLYHGRIEFPNDYPFAPPNFLFLTPNGRFETRTKICLSVTTFHKEMWQPAWGVRTMLLAIREHFKVEDLGAVGYLSYEASDRQRLAEESHNFRCPMCKMSIGGERVERQEKGSDRTQRAVLAFAIFVLAVLVFKYLL